MKKIKYLFEIIVISMLIVGCGGESGGSCCLDEEPYTMTLYENDTVQVYPGDTLTPLDQPTVIDVTHTYNSNIKNISIIVGTARLIRGDYEITN